MRRRGTLVTSERHAGAGARPAIQLDVDVPDRPGELAKLAAIVGEAGINIDAISAESAGGRSYMSLIVNQPMQAREALMKHGYVGGHAQVALGVDNLEKARSLV